MLKSQKFNYKFKIKKLLSPSHSKYSCKEEGVKRCFVFLAADYGNLGDVAITYAQERILKEYFPEHEIVDVPISQTLSVIKSIQKSIRPDDIITIVGGGNMSDVYFDIELLRQMVVDGFPQNRVISFPQTMFFSSTEEGNYMSRRASKIYQRHRHLEIMAREKMSFETMRSLMPHAKITLMPDVVMTLDTPVEVSKREGILFCMRNDLEKDTNARIADDLLEGFRQKGIPTTIYDTHIEKKRMDIPTRLSALKDIWSAFAKHRWIITDRLHGMIFAYITQTPCIVFPNNNFKVAQCYQWIKDCGYIFLVGNEKRDEIEQIMHQQPSMNFSPSQKKIKNYYDLYFQK